MAIKRIKFKVASAKYYVEDGKLVNHPEEFINILERIGSGLLFMFPYTLDGVYAQNVSIDYEPIKEKGNLYIYRAIMTMNYTVPQPLNDKWRIEIYFTITDIPRNIRFFKKVEIDVILKIISSTGSAGPSSHSEDLSFENGLSASNAVCEITKAIERVFDSRTKQIVGVINRCFSEKRKQ